MWLVWDLSVELRDFKLETKIDQQVKPWALVSFVNFVNHLLLFEVKPPRQLGALHNNLSCLWRAMRKFMRVMILHRKGKDQLEEKRKVFERDPTRARVLWVAHRYLNEDVGFKWEPKLRWNKSLVSCVLNCNMYVSFHSVYILSCVYLWVQVLHGLATRYLQTDLQIWFEFQLSRRSKLRVILFCVEVPHNCMEVPHFDNLLRSLVCF